MFKIQIARAEGRRERRDSEYLVNIVYRRFAKSTIFSLIYSGPGPGLVTLCLMGFPASSSFPEADKVAGEPRSAAATSVAGQPPGVRLRGWMRSPLAEVEIFVLSLTTSEFVAVMVVSTTP